MNQSFRALSVAKEETLSDRKEEMGDCGGVNGAGEWAESPFCSEKLVMMGVLLSSIQK